MPKLRSGKVVTRKSTSATTKRKSLQKKKITSANQDTTTTFQKSLTEQLKEAVDENVHLELQNEELQAKIKTLEEQLEDARYTEIMLRELLIQRDIEISEIKVK